MIKKFKKKPIVIEAIQYTGTNDVEIEEWSCRQVTPDLKFNRMFVKTLEGVMEVSVGAWVIKGVEGEFYPCQPDIFEKTYEPVE